MTDELIGKKIGGYEIIDLIGRGGMAAVYRAHQVSMNRTVAIKILPRQFVSDDTYLQRFNREVKIVAQLEHRNIVPVHDYGEQDGQPYIVMRYMPGGSVDDLLEAGSLPMEQIISILSQIAPALDYAHSKQVLHRDIKPSNVLLDDDGGAYLTDFGIARIMSDNSGTGKLTTQGVVGTPSYMSPEQAQGHAIDRRSDVYSLGVMLFEMATGRRPFESETPYSIAVMQVTQQPPAPRSINPQLPPTVENVIYKAMSKRADDRYADAVGLAEAVKKAVLPGKDIMHDTQPKGIQVRPPAPAPLVYAPAAPQQPVYPTPSPGSMPAVPLLRPRRKPNLLLSAVVGGLLGCGLLALIVGIAAFVITSTQQEEADAAATLTATYAVVPANPTDAPAGASPDAITLTPLPGFQEGEAPVSVDATPTSGLQPLGVRLTSTPVDSSTLFPDATIIYFAERDDNYDLFRLNFRTGEDIRLTTDAAIDMYPQVSPDGRQIVFVSNRDGDYDLYLMDVDGDNLRQLTRNAVVDRIPAWSPDGRWIVFSMGVGDEGRHDLYQIRPDGSDLSLIYSDNRRNSHPRWSEDDQYLVFTGGAANFDNTWDILRLNRRTDIVENLTNNDVKDWSPTFAPDGNSILYLTAGVGGAAIAVMELDGSESRIIHDDAGEEWGALFSPDGRYIIFTSDLTGRDELYLMDADGSNVLQITIMGGSYATWLNYAD
ncbi:MAG: protein kinase [Chloroflexota bacterium]|nr:protein kinase [Chloroflexota bacterium]